MKQSAYTEAKPQSPQREEPPEPMNVTDGLAVEAKANREIPFADQNSDSSESEDLANVLTSKVNRRKTNLNLKKKQSSGLQNAGLTVAKTKTLGQQARSQIAQKVQQKNNGFFGESQDGKSDIL